MTLFIIAVVMAKVGVDEAKASGAVRLDRERQPGREAAAEGAGPGS